jgi:predicted porin
MQKKIIALAVAGLMSGAAFAQSNVTISGTLNGTFGQGQASSATASNCGAPGTESCSISNRQLLLDNSSEIAFAGSEDLGGGMAASWRIASGVGNMFEGRQRDANAAVGTGTQLSQGFASRNSKLAISGGFGEVNYGFWDTPYHQASAAYELWGAAVGSNAAHSASLLSGASGVQAATASSTNQLLGNGTGARVMGISYYTPVMSGVQAKIMYSPNEQKESASVAGAANNTKFDPSLWSMNLTYNNGPLALALAYETRKDISAGQMLASATHGTAVSTFGVHNGVVAAATGLAGALGAHAVGTVTGSKDTFWRLGGKYAFGAFTVSAAWDRSEWKLQHNNTVANVLEGYKRNAYFLGGAYAMGKHTFGVQYARANDGSCGTNSGVCSTAGLAANQWSLGYSNALSKRTNVYVNWTRIRNDSQGFYDFAITPVGVAAGSRGADPQFIGAGMRHTF